MLERTYQFMLGYPWWQIGRAAEAGLRVLAVNPLLYIGIALMIWELRRNARLERSSFGVRVTRLMRPLYTRFWQALLMGLLGSLLCWALGITLRPQDIWAASGILALLALIRLRLAASIYSISALVLAAVAAQSVPPPVWIGNSRWLSLAWADLQGLSISGWLAVGSFATLASATLVWWNRRTGPAALVVVGKRGRPIGGLLVQLAFVVPLFMWTPGVMSIPGFVTAGWPWLGPRSGGLSLAAMPLWLGHSEVFTTEPPIRGLHRVTLYSLLAAAVLGLDSYAVWRWGVRVGAIGPVLAVGLEEFRAWRGRRMAHRAEPVYGQSPDGVRVLAVAQGSLAETMALEAGEVITHVNQVPVHSAYDLHFAFDQNPAYAKLQVLDQRGEPRIVGKAVYTGERHRLGLILLPDAPEGLRVRPSASGLLQSLYMRPRRVMQTRTGWAMAETAAAVVAPDDRP